MKKYIKNVLLSMLSLASFSFAQADTIRLGQGDYGGNGCPSGSASFTLSDDQQSLSILFDEYFVEAGGDTRKRFDRKSCNITIPVHVPQGYSVSVFQVDYRGYTNVPSGGEARFSVEYFFAGATGPRVVESMRGPLDDEYLLTDRLAASAMVWSRCGEDTILRVNSSMLAKSNRWNEQTLATVDSADIKAGLIYHFQFRRCR